MTDRDEKILTMTATGHTAPAIAVALGISVPTVQRARRKGAVTGTPGRPRGTKKPTGQVSLSQDTRTRPRHAPGDRRPEKEILQELFATDLGQVSMLRQTSEGPVPLAIVEALGAPAGGPIIGKKALTKNGNVFRYRQKTFVKNGKVFRYKRA
ncbi:MAG: hypothetical protein DDT32_00849 [Syntrophomonadaceae bacterium]|nr:hypothetical protein [Bacillota bacterium]